jgi:RNA-directed DNA polymerase
MQPPGEKVTVSQAQRPTDWNSIDWTAAVASVRKLRQAIFRATREGDLKKVRTLQRIMLRSYENRVLSVRRVTQTNRGKNSPGVDKVVLKTPEARGRLVDRLGAFEPWKPLPAKRVYIPKANGKQRPLGIPSIMDRALQAIVKNALEPFWEAKFEDSSCGFRPGRCCHDALARIFALGRSSSNRRWVLDADIKGCFDNIDHEKLLKVIGNFPARELIRQWLKAGYLEEGVYHDTDSGTPQGGVISPLLANIALHGMEEALGIQFCIGRGANKGRLVLQPNSPGLVRYADDFLVFARTREEAEQAKRKLEAWFKDRGLVFSEEKTRVIHLEEGFDFLGFNVRLFPDKRSKQGYRLLIRPSGKSVKAHARRLKELFREYRGHPADTLCKMVNPVIKGWTNYFRVGVSSRIFSKLGDYLFKLQWRWARWQHPRKSKGWRRRRYWGTVPGLNDSVWNFKGNKEIMRRHNWTAIKRHTTVRRGACWDDPDLEGYWKDRKAQEAVNSLTPFQRTIAEQQKWVCPKCGDFLLNGEEWQEHHVVARRDGGKRILDNIQLVHLFCHQAEHGKKRAKEAE